MNEYTLVGHRGLMARFPENTLLSLREALDAGAAWVEFDIQMTADGQFYLLHDAKLDRTTNQQGTIFSQTAESLAAVSAGYPGRFAAVFAQEPLATLEQALALVGRYPQAGALVEIKTESLHHFGHDVVMPPLLQQLAPYQSQCRLISFDAASLVYASRHSSLVCGWVMARVNQSTLALAEQLALPMLACDYRHLPGGAVPLPQAEWMVYDVMDPAVAVDCRERGVALIETADVSVLSQLLQQRADG